MLVTRARQTHFTLWQFLSDLLAIGLGLAGAWWIRLQSGLIPTAGDWDNTWYVREFPQTLAVWIVAYHLTGNYANHPQVISFNKARRILVGSGLAVTLVVAKNYFLRVPDLSRLMYPIALATVTFATVAMRLVLQRLIVRFLAGRSLPRSRVLIVGLGPLALRVAARIRMHPEYAYELAGFLNHSPAKVGRRIGGVPVMGTVDDLREVLRTRDIQDVFISQGEMGDDALWRLFLESETNGARVHVIPTLSEMMRTTIFYDELVGVPLYRIRETPLQGANLLVKRAFDTALAALGLFFFAPLFAALALLVKRASPGPVFYRQRRLSMDGTEFDIWKFRTMPVDAERNGPAWGDREDPRASRVGNWMRRWSLDELPQLWNVLRGDMSLVGPRPERPCHADRFRESIPHYMARHHVLAGMTGWAQVHGLRGDTSIVQRLRYDLYYIENWSLWLDVKILMMTFFQPAQRRRFARRSRVASRDAVPTQRAGEAAEARPIRGEGPA